MEGALIHLPPAFLLINILLLSDICYDKYPAQFLGPFGEYESTISAVYVFCLFPKEIPKYLLFSILK